MILSTTNDHESRVLWIFGAAAVAMILFSIWLAVKKEAKQLELIAAGRCSVITEQLHQPPPTYVCTYRDPNSSACITQVPIYKDPIMRSLWSCELDNGEQKQFWRPKEYDRQ